MVESEERIKSRSSLSCRTNRVNSHNFATQLLADGYHIRTVQELPGHKDVRTTMITIHVAN